MTAAYAPTLDSLPLRRSPWIALVDAALYLVLAFWGIVDLGAALTVDSMRRGKLGDGVSVCHGYQPVHPKGSRRSL